MQTGDQQNKGAALTADEEKGLWQRVIQNQDIEARRSLVDHHLPVARAIAASLFSLRPGADLEFSDYMQYAVIGLLEAIDRYDPEKNASFKTYAAYRIRGSVLSGIQKTSERAEQGAFMKRLREERAASLKKNQGNIKGDLFYEMVDVAVGLALGYMLEDSGMFMDEEKRQVDDPYHHCELKMLQDRIRLIVEALPEQERLVITYHYYQYLGFKEVGDILGVSVGRISQIHANALILLHQGYKSLNQFDVEY